MVVRTILKLWLLVWEGNKGDDSIPVSVVDYLDTGKYPDWICGYLTVCNLVQVLKMLFLYTQGEKDTVEEFGLNF